MGILNWQEFSVAADEPGSSSKFEPFKTLAEDRPRLFQDERDEPPLEARVRDVFPKE